MRILFTFGLRKIHGFLPLMLMLHLDHEFVFDENLLVYKEFGRNFSYVVSLCVFDFVLFRFVENKSKKTRLPCCLVFDRFACLRLVICVIDE